MPCAEIALHSGCMFVQWQALDTHVSHTTACPADLYIPRACMASPSVQSIDLFSFYLEESSHGVIPDCTSIRVLS